MLVIVDLQESIVETVREILRIARFTLQEQGTHLPTAILHTIERMIPMVLPFKDQSQRTALVAHVKEQAALLGAYAVTTVTSAKIVDSRTGKERHCLVAATAIQGGRPYVVVQQFSKDSSGIVRFGKIKEGEDAEIPGQMIIIPDWDNEVCH